MFLKKIMQRLGRRLKILFPVLALLVFYHPSASQSEASDRNQVLRVPEKMKSHFQVLRHYAPRNDATPNFLLFRTENKPRRSPKNP
jgi:hypothetical protein